MKFTTEHIVQYLADSLSKETTQLFEQELLTNPELQAELEIQQLSNSLIGINEENKILSSIQSAQRNYQRKNNYKKIGLATILLVGGASTFWYLNPVENTPIEEKIGIENEKENEHQLNRHELIDSSFVKDTIAPKTKNQPNRSVKFEVSVEKQNAIQPNKKEALITDTQNIITIKEVKQAVQNQITSEKITTNKVLGENPSVNLINPCDIFSIETQLAIEHACPQLSLGAIDIINTTGGLSPYTYELKLNNISIKDWSELKTGTYLFVTKDAANCKSEKSITIIDKDCPLNYDFNPSLNQKWEALKALDNGKITITHAKSGEQILETRLISDETITWDGLKNNGDYSLGFHIFVIEYENNKIVKGKITVSQ